MISEFLLRTGGTPPTQKKERQANVENIGMELSIYVYIDIYAPRPDPWSIIPIPDLHRKPLVEAQRRGLGARIRDVLGLRHERGHAGDRNDVPMVCLDHRGEELLDERKMRDDVHVKDFLDRGWVFVEDEPRGADSCVVDEDSRIPVGGADLVGDVLELGRGGDVDGVEVGVPCWSWIVISWWAGW